MNIWDVPIEKLLVHRPPMLLIDRAVAVLDNGVQTEVVIRPDHIFMTPLGVPAFVAVEFMAQTIGVYDGWVRLQQNGSPRIGYLVGTRQMELMCDYFMAGQVLEVETHLIWDGVNLLQFRCSTTDKSTRQELARATLNVFSPSRDETEGKL